ncbi:MAG: hypothetical protein AAF616_04755 [Bacteroidota bacterium]
MKKHILSIAAVLVAVASFAQTSYTVSNNPANPAQFTEIQAAINAASDGDTIYVAGSNIRYGNMLVNKRLVLIGAGYQLLGVNSRTEVTQLDIVSDTDNGGGSESTISGFLIVGDFDGDTDQIISGVVLERNWFNNVNLRFRNNEGWNFRNNIVYMSSNGGAYDFKTGTAMNLTVQNNILQGDDRDARLVVNSTSALVLNNVFFDYYFQLNDCTLLNNIFINHRFNTDFNGTFFDAFSNNVFYSNNIFFAGLSNPSGTSNTFINSIFDNPGFVSEDNQFYSFGEDLNLTTASPGKSAGTDGTDIGVFGGNFPMVFEPANPEITQLLINTVQVPVGGELEFTVQAEGRQ